MNLGYRPRVKGVRHEVSRITVVAVAVSRVHREELTPRRRKIGEQRQEDPAREKSKGEEGGRKGKKKPQNVSLSASARMESRNSASKVGGRSNLSPNKFQPLDCGE